MGSTMDWTQENKSAVDDALPGPSELAVRHINNLRETAITLLREVESLRKTHQISSSDSVGLQEEVQRYEIELIRQALHRTHGNQRRAAQLLGVKATTLNCKIKRFGISLSEDGDWSVLA
jgi:DNA-binding NtrC family response regulator